MKRTLLLIALMLSGAFSTMFAQDYVTTRGLELFNQGSYTEALPLLQRAAKAGDNKALAPLGMMYKNGWGVQKDASVALSLIKKGVTADDMDCIAEMGMMMWNGDGVKKNEEEAVKYFKRSADIGSALGASYYATCAENGYHMEANLEVAIEYAERAAQKGINIGYAANLNYNAAKYERSLYWLTLPNTTYTPVEQYMLATIYNNGLGLAKKNPKEAMKVLDAIGGDISKLPNWANADSLRRAANDLVVAMSRLTAPAISSRAKAFIEKWQSPAPPAIASAGKGEITIKATVSASGEILSTRIQYRVLQRLDEDALNLIKSLPAIVPGTQGGSGVSMDVVFGVRYFPLRVTINSYSVN